MLGLALLLLPAAASSEVQPNLRTLTRLQQLRPFNSPTWVEGRGMNGLTQSLTLLTGLAEKALQTRGLKSRIGALLIWATSAGIQSSTDMIFLAISPLVATHY